MAETCIVCLGDLRTATEDPQLDSTDPSPSGQAHTSADDETLSGETKPTVSKRQSKSLDADDEVIAHLLPCKHELHNACLKPWVERANSCPICRAVFNMVQLTHFIGGPVFDSYAVQDKVQEAEIDPTMILEDELFAIEAWEPCLVCGSADDTHEVMYCDGCDKLVHVFCAGYDESVPDNWHCRSCLVSSETEIGSSGGASARTSAPRPRTRSHRRRRSRRTDDVIWARVWQEVSRRINLDLDFPFDDESEQRTEEQRRELEQWERRLQIGSTQGATARLRDIAAANLRPAPASAPESQEEIRAWNAFDKARELHTSPQSSRRRKRKTTASPASPGEPETSEQPQLKRPRLRRPRTGVEHVANDVSVVAAESSTNAAQRSDEKNTFLSSLLRDVKNKPLSASSPTASEHPNGANSPRNLSPVRSPDSSGHATPRAASLTPPPQRPMSPPLSSTIIPMQSPVSLTFSPYSPTSTARDRRPILLPRGRQRNRPIDNASTNCRAASSSPNGGLSYSTKEELQRMVKAALGSRYRDKQISKDQYTEINREVSRKLYDLVSDTSALSEQSEREKWQSIADVEVRKAVSALSNDISHNDES